MHDWLLELGEDQRVLDLGAASGALESAGYSCSMVLVDCDQHAFSATHGRNPRVHRVLATGESLPFPPATFDLILCNHVLEHIVELAGSLKEIGRVLKPAGRLYVAVPNGHGLCDGIYRYVFEGGDHVNRFDRSVLVETVESSVAIRLTAWQKLYSSFAYLSRVKDLPVEVRPSLAPRLRRFARLPASAIKLLQGGLYVFTRLADRIAGVDWALYGWAFFFERAASPQVVERQPFVNVCLHCGTGAPASSLQRIRRLFYRCGDCGRRGIYFPPFRNGM